MNCGIGIFVKTPSLSPVKTRLWPGLGRQCSEALYLVSAEAVASVAEAARRQAGVQPYWAVAESAALNTEAWVDLPHLSQGIGSLGERMAHVYRMLRKRHHSAVLIGADTPQLVPEALQQAAEWLSADEPRLAIGRALDGGFWLFGGNRPLPLQAWLNPRYSTSAAADELIVSMEGYGCWRELETLCDIDTATDLPDVHARLSQLTAPTDAQRRMVAWLDGLPSGACP
ncbi:MAG: DUF2064 domain-containing protein [Pseudomonadota bacterium]|nr:DUF2064 domain-containing protein [Pseudomonadota bacterium]